VKSTDQIYFLEHTFGLFMELHFINKTISAGSCARQFVHQLFVSDSPRWRLSVCPARLYKAAE